MRPLKTLSKLLQIGLLLTFLLPFFPAGCKDSSAPQSDSTAVETAAPAIDTSIDVPSIAEDSIDIESFQGKTAQNKLQKTDSLKIDPIQSTEKDSVMAQKNLKDISLSEILIEKFKFLKPLLRPEKKYTGLGFVIEMSLSFFMAFGIIPAFYLWIIATVLKFRKKKLMLVLNIIGFVCLAITYPVMFTWGEETRLWGYWVCFWWAAGMILLDFYIVIRMKKQKASIQQN